MANKKWHFSWVRRVHLFFKKRGLKRSITFGLLNWRTPGTYVSCVDRVPKKKSIQKVGFIHSYTWHKSKIFIVHKTQVKSEQQQQNLGSFAQYGHRNRDGSHGDGFTQVLLTAWDYVWAIWGRGTRKICTGLGMTNLVSWWRRGELTGETKNASGSVQRQWAK
jgi:hypothetical protein